MSNIRKLENKLRVLFPILSGGFVWLIIQFTTEEPAIFRGIMHNIFECAIAFELTRLIYIKTQPKEISFDNLKTKLAQQILWTFIVTIPILMLFYCAWKYTFTVVRPRFSDVTPKYYFAQIGSELLVISWATLVYYLFKIVIFWNKSTLEKATIEKENIQTQYLAIKNEISPHFLFNNLNTLHGLIFENQQKAGDYLLNLSDIYRYILNNNSSELVSLHAELEIVDAYFSLLKNRHGDNLTWVNEFSEDSISKMQVAPLVLQMLLENAVKHNVVDRYHQLEIRFHKEGEFMIFENNRHQKIATNSSKLGLKNIINRYQFLSELPVIIDESEDKYIVKIPIIKI